MRANRLAIAIRPATALLALIGLSAHAPAARPVALTGRTVEELAAVAWLDTLNLSHYQQGRGRPAAGKALTRTPLSRGGVVYVPAAARFLCGHIKLRHETWARLNVMTVTSYSPVGTPSWPWGRTNGTGGRHDSPADTVRPGC